MSSVDINTLINGLAELNISLNDEKLKKFVIFKQLLKEWNEKINITSIKDDVEIDIKHFLDSVIPLTTGLIKDSSKIIDVGTGGGFPGIPIKIINERNNIVLLDSLNKRIKFLDEVINKLDLKNIQAIHGRSEDFGKNQEYREKFDISISRAVASLNILSEYCLPFVKIGGFFIAMKGENIAEEISDSRKAINILGGKIVDKIDVKIPLSNIVHSLLIIEKVKSTPMKYPRNPGKPKKNPL